MLEYLWQKYDEAKARLIGYLASFFGLRVQILNLRERSKRVLDKAQRVGDPALIGAARSMAQQVEQLYVDQVEAEQKVLEARDKIGQVEAGKTGGGLGALPLAALAAAAAVIVTATAVMVTQFKKYDYLNRALTDLEKKILTPGEYREALGAGGGSWFQGIGTMAAVGAALAIGYFVFSARRRA